MQTIYDAKILIVDDNQDLLNLVTTALRSTGYNQLTACTGCAAAQAAFAANRPDLMILDINLPDGDGFTLFRTLHSMADIPALFLSARDADADRLFGLGLGADDYLTKPFLTQELLLRIQRILQRCYRGELWRTAAKPLQLGQRTVYLADALVRLPDGTAQPLTATERALLQKLAENRGPDPPLCAGHSRYCAAGGRFAGGADFLCGVQVQRGGCNRLPGRRLG